MAEAAKVYHPKIDLMRIIACIAVITIHVTATPVMALQPKSVQQIVFIIANRLAKPSVPLFIFISGYLAYQPTRSFQHQRYFKKIKRLFVPYALWTLLYLLLFVKTANYPLTLQFYLKHLALGDMVYHLYFMVILIQLTLLSPLLSLGARRLGVMPFWLITFCLQLLAGMVSLPYTDRLFFSYIAYYTLGFALHRVKLHKRLVAGITALLGIAYTVAFIAAINHGVAMPQWAAASLYTLYSLAACAFLFSWLPNSELPPRTRQFALATEQIYYAHPLAIMASVYLSGQLMLYSIIGQSVFAAVLIFVTVVPAAMLYQNFTKN